MVTDWWFGGDAAPAGRPAASPQWQRQRLVPTALVGVSYAVDLGVLTLFWLGGAVPAALLAIYAAGALAHLLVFGGVQWLGLAERTANPDLTGLQMSWAIALQLGSILWAPAVAGYFLGVVFVVFSFGALRLPLRSALGLWLATAVMLAALLWLLPPFAVMPLEMRVSPWVRLASAIGFATLLLRCIVLNFRAMSMHTRSLQQAARLAAEARAAQERATRDGLTGALNRDGLMPLLQAALDRVRRREAPCCVAMIDIDWFKSINDDLGHLAGDRALRMLVELMQEHLRAGDHRARFGGEEFVLLMPATSESDAIEVAERLRHIVAVHPWSNLAEGMTLTVSVGLAQAHDRD
ncbi:MAG: GGDEF domain-containing protein, partial [Betaproteobacteria bacterium]|nr:GGDEF domain-containing protein [Betaproteobacteria bacterium]